MSIRLDPRRLGALKQLAGDAGMRPGDLVRTWVEERIDASRGAAQAPTGDGLAARVDELTRRVDALERGAGAAATSEPAAETEPAPELAARPPEPALAPEPEPTQVTRPKRTRTKRVSAAPSGDRVALHDEMIDILHERGPMTAAELAGAIAERGRYAPPRSGKALDAAMVSQRVSNPTYRGRFVRSDGRIGLAE
jgi:hypothetical protein